LPDAVEGRASAPPRRTKRMRAASVADFLGWPGWIVVGFAVLAIVGPAIAPKDPLALRVGEVNLQPFQSADFVLGTDQLGRDLLSRVIVGARLSFFTAVVPVACGGLIGMVLGAMAGLGPRPLALVIMRLTDVALAFPSIMLALAVVAMLGPSFTNALLSLTIVFVAPMTRVSRGLAVEIASRPYVEAARLSGARTFRIVRDFALPNMLPSLAVFAAAASGTMLLTGAGLSFLGAGAQPPDIEWGRMVSDGRIVFLINPWPSILPGLFIFLVSLGFNRFADRLRDRLDPRWEQAR
jgi:peptide/nickel transport system permease protein